MTRRYKAFISYSWSDKHWAGWLHRALETYRTPRALVGAATPQGPVPAGLHPIFKDREEEAAGHSIGAAIEAAMAASDFLIVVCSPRSAQSTWVNREIAWFKRHRDPQRILAVVVEGEPGASLSPDAAGAECFPPALLYQVDENLAPTGVLEDPPLAADARAEGDGKRGAKLKLAAALLGIGLDDLVRRDERRRQLRRRLVTAGALSVAVATSALAFVAVNARDAARIAQRDAEAQRDEAQSLIEFMLTDFRGELESLGRLDVLERTGTRLLEAYAREDLATLDADALGRRARVLLLLGEVDNARGKLTAALARYNEAAAATGELLARNPGKAQQIFDHAQSVYWVGYIAWQKGEIDTAQQSFSEYHRYAQALVAIDPDKKEWRQELSYAHSNLGTLALDTGKPAEAEVHFRKSLAIEKALAAAAPDDVERALSLGQAYAWVADALHRQAKLHEARDAREAEVALYTALAASSPKNVRIALFRSTALSRLAQIESALGLTDEALDKASDAANLAMDKVKEDPTRLYAVYNAATALTVMASELRLQGKHVEARKRIAAAQSLNSKLGAGEGDEMSWFVTSSSQTELELARLEASDHSAESARRIAIDVSRSLESSVGAENADPVLIRIHGSAIVLARELGEVDEDAMTALVARLRSIGGPESLALIVEASLFTGDRDRAADAARRLFAAGYRRADFLRILAKEPWLVAASPVENRAER